MAGQVCMRCPHGFAGSSTLIFAGACFLTKCVLEVAETTRRAGVADIELPLQTDPIRWPNEWRLPLGQVASGCLPFLLALHPPMFEAIAFHEQSGAFGHAWASVGIRAASVANRPSALPPVVHSAHFIAGVREFHGWYGHPIPFLTTHWDCAPAGYASKARWKSLMQSGELPRNVEDAVWCRAICRLFAGETTKSAMEVFLGPPSVKTNLALWGGDRLKDWWWFQSEGVPVLSPPLLSVPASARSTHHDRDGLLLEKLKLSRGTTPWVFAEAHAQGWAQTVRDAQSQPMIAAGTVAASFDYYLQVARARLTLWAAADVTIVSRLYDTSVAVDRCILVPVYVEDDIMALVPDSGFFGVACTKGQLAEQSVRLAREAGVSPSTNLVNVSMNSLEGRDYVFSAVATAPPSAAGGMRIGDVAWRTLDDLHGLKAFAYASLAMRRELQLRQASGEVSLVIGALGDAVPLVPNSMGSAWSSAPDDAAAPAEWLLFLERDARAAASLAAAMTRLDAGDGRLANWALNVKSTRDVAHEIPMPPQGRVRLDPSLRWLLLPEYFVPYPVPYTSQMLVRLPAQQVPPGFVPTHVSEAMEAWAIRRVHMHCLIERLRAVWFWENMPDQSVAALTHEQEREWLQGAPKGPGWLHLGSGAFKRIAHLDGIGYWVANAIVQQVDAQGRLTVFDWTVGFRSEFSTEDMMNMFDVKSDLELLSQLFDGTRYKAAPDRGLTLAPNLDSYASRAVQIAKELGSLAKLGRYVVRPLYYVEDATDTGVWPTFFIPQTSISVGGVDQPYKPLKKRRVADASGAHVEVLARHRDDGAPDGEPYVSLNERYGPMRPAAGQQVCEVPHRLTPFGSLCDCCQVVLVRHSADGAHMWWGMLFCWRCLEGNLWRALEPLKWHKEGKHRVHHIYRACAYLGAAADIIQEDLTVLEDDWKTQFWQFRVHPIELPTSTMYAWVELYSHQIAWCHVAAYVNDMGKSPSSNITSSTSIHHVEVWRRNMVAIAAPVIATMGEEMNDMLDTRRERFGEMQALLWAAFAFTDDIILILVSAVLGALGAQEWDRISEVLKIQMSESDKRGCGTCPVHIGIRFVVNGGFGCAPPQKRVRALSGLRHAIDGTLHHATPIRAKAFESNCGLVGYLVDALAIDRALLRGIKRPLELAVFLDSEVTLTWDGLVNHLELEFLISARGAASFDTAVRDALLLAGKSTATQRIAARRIRMGSDACTDAAHPAIYGMAESLAYVFPLTGDWLRLHVTVTESAGACLDFLVFPRRFPLALFCNETDASAAHAMVLGRSKSPTLKKMYSLLRKDPHFQAAAQRSTSQQVSGIANMTRDAGSRGHVEALRTYAAAMKMNIVVVELSEHELGFMASILEATLEIGEALLVHPEPGTAMDVSDEAPLWQQLEPGAVGATSMAVVPRIAYGGEDQEVIKFMPRVTSPPSRLQPRPCTRVEGHRWLADCRYDPPRCGAVHCAQPGCEVAFGCDCVDPRTVLVLRVVSLLQELQPETCTSVEGHRWLVNCRYEPPRCGAVWCGQVGCEAMIRCDCADPQERFRPRPLRRKLEPRRTGAGATASVPAMKYGGESQEVIQFMLRAASPERHRSDSGEPADHSGVRAMQASPSEPAVHAVGGTSAHTRVSRRDVEGSPGLAPGNFLSPGETRLVTAPVSPVPGGSELRVGRALSPRVQLQSAPVASPVDARQPAVARSGHMRPNTAAALRQLGTAKLVAKLALDESEWALLPHSTERLAAIVKSVAAAKLAAIPINTVGADDNGVRWLGLVCEDLDTTPLRPGPEHAFEEREALLGAHFLCFHSEHAKVNVHFAVTPSGARRTRVKPSSSFSAYLAARRALEDYGSYVPPMKTVLKVLKGLDKQMLLEFGEDALAKIQALPWSTSHLDAFQSTLTSGDRLQWHRSKLDMCHCMLAFALGVACRKEESPRYRRSNVAWFTGKLVEVELDRDGIASLCNAYFCRMRPVSSKTDQNNAEWGNHYMWFRVDTSAWWSLGSALMWIEQTYFVEPQHRLSTPLFFNPEVTGFVPFSLTVMASMLNELMIAAGIILANASVYDRFTWHSARVTLACQLRKLNYGWDKITSHLRHKSAESARIYGRLDAISYADTAAKASRADASGVLAADLPEIDPVTKHAGMQDAIAAMEAMVVADDDKLSGGVSRRGHERAQDVAEREALEELAAGVAAAKASAKRKSSKRTVHEGTTGDVESFDVGEDAEVEAHTSDSWGIVGRDVSIPNAAWRGELDDGCVAVCRVVGLASRAYVALTGDFHYTFTVPHMRLYLQTSENAQLLHDLGGVAAIKGAPTAQAIGTRAKRKPVSRRVSTPGMRLLLLSTLLLGLACGGQTADPSESDDPMEDDLRGRPLAIHGDAELLATLHEWAARDRTPVSASPQPWGSHMVVAADVSDAGPPSTIEQYLRQRDVAAVRAQAEVVRPPRPQSRRRPGWAVAAGHSPNLDMLQYWNEQWLASAHWYDDPLLDSDAEAQAWRVVEAHAAALSRPQGGGTRHMSSDVDDYIPSYSRPSWEHVAFVPEDGDIFDEWLNGGDDGRQQAAWEAAVAVWDHDFLVGQGRQRDRMFCVTEYMLRMPHGDSYSNDAAWMVILADVLFSDVREAGWLRRIIARRISAAARRRWRPPSLVSSAESVKRRRRYDGDDSEAGSGGKGAAGGFCVAPSGSA